MNIRIARRNEIPVFRTLELAAARAFDDIGHGWIAALEPLPSNEVAAVLNSGGAFLALDDAERPIGFAVAHWLGDDAYLRELGVHPDAARRGVGRALVQHVINEARQRGCRRLVLTTFREVPWNAPWYTRLGFRILEPASIGPWLARVRAEETAAGLDREPRVAMFLPLGEPI